MLVAESVTDYYTDVGEGFELMSVVAVAEIPAVFPIPSTKYILSLIYAVFLAILGHPIRHYPRFFGDPQSGLTL